MYATLIPGATEWQQHEGVPTLEDMQAHVGGHVDAMRLTGSYGGPGVHLWFHDEGKLISLPPSLALTEEGNVLDLLAGPVMATRTDADGNTSSLTHEDMVAVLVLDTDSDGEVLVVETPAAMYIVPRLALDTLQLAS
jgi:hypothetical protein